MSFFHHNSLPKIIFVIVKSIENQLNGSNNLTDEHLLTLHSLFGAVLERSLELLENPNAVTLYKTADGSRTLIEVKGDRDIVYKLFQDINYCSCPAFLFQVLQSKCDITCKHVVAAIISKLTGKSIVQVISQQQYEFLVMSVCDSDENKLD